MKQFFSLCSFLLVLMTSPAFAVDESKYDEFIGAAATEYDVDRNLIKAIIKQESAFRDDIGSGTVVSSAGAIGAMQLMPGTAEQMGFTPEQMKDPETNIRAGAKYIKFLMSKSYIGNDPILIMAAYNAGPGNVFKHNGVPPFDETVNYVLNGASYYASYSGISPLDVSSVPPPSVGTIPGGRKGTIPVAINLTPTISANSADILNKFETYTGVSAATLNGLFKGTLGALALFFAALQLLFFWSDAVTKGDNEPAALLGASTNTLRTFVVVVILFNFITT
jgi:hypothetical protein